MAYENIRLRKRNMVNVEGYFYMMDDDVDSLVVKTDDGTQAYSYPLDTTISTQVLSLEHDGRNFWSLQQTDTTEVTIRRWYINNYVCTLRESFVLNSTNYSGHNFISEAFTIEHYETSFSANESAGQTTLSVDDNSNMAEDIILVLGPNSSGQMEEREVDSVGIGDVTLKVMTDYAYETDDPISFYRFIWLFNDYDGLNAGDGGLYKFNPYTSALVTYSGGGAYNGVNACTFYDFSDVFGAGSQGIAYVRSTNMIFLDPSNLGESFGSMSMDNLEDDQAATINIFDVSIEGTNVYRLQDKATYYGTTQSFGDGPYNYQLSTLQPFITSISLQANPAILPANQLNTSTITAIVKDQFDQPIASRNVYFTDDDSVGEIQYSPVSTNSEGIATTTYLAGNQAREVRITATAQQTT